MWYTIQSIDPRHPSFDTILDELKQTQQPKTLLIDRAVYLVGDVSVPEWIRLVFSRKGRLLAESGQTLTLARPPQTGLCQVFGASSAPWKICPNVVFSTPSAIVHPEWWGAVGEDGPLADLTRRNTFALRSALASIRGRGGEVSLVQGEYYVDPVLDESGPEKGQPLRLGSNMTMRGGGNNLVKLTFARDGLVVEPGAKNVVLEGMVLQRLAADDRPTVGIRLTTGGPCALRNVGIVGFRTGVLQESTNPGRESPFRGLRLQKCTFAQCADGVVVECSHDVLLDQCRCTPSQPAKGKPWVFVRGHTFGKVGAAPCRNVLVRDNLFEKWMEWAIRAVNVDGLGVEGTYAEVYYSLIPKAADRPFIVVEPGGLSGDGAWVGLNYFNELYHGHPKEGPVKQVYPSAHIVWKGHDGRDRMRTRTYTIDGRANEEPPKNNKNSPISDQAFFIRPGATVWNGDPRPGGVVGWVCVSEERKENPKQGDWPEWNWLHFGRVAMADPSPFGWIPSGFLYEEEP